MTSGWLPELKFDRGGRRLSAHLAPSGAGDPRNRFSNRMPVADFEAPRRCPRISRRSRLTRRRHLAATGARGITVWDLPTGTPLALLPVTSAVSHLHFDPAGAAPDEPSPDPAVAHFVRPIRSHDRAAAVITVVSRHRWFRGELGRAVVALAIYDGGGLVFDPEHPTDSRRFLPHRDARCDRHQSRRPVVRHRLTHPRYAETLGCAMGRLVHDFPELPRPCGGAFFSPDGRWLAVAINSRGWELFDTTSWISRKSAWACVRASGVFPRFRNRRDRPSFPSKLPSFWFFFYGDDSGIGGKRQRPVRMPKPTSGDPRRRVEQFPNPAS